MSEKCKHEDAYALYCKTCSCLFCVGCIELHSGHDIKKKERAYVEQTIQKYKDIMKEITLELSDKIDVLSRMKECKTNEEVLQLKKEINYDEFINFYTKLKETYDVFKKSLLKQESVEKEQSVDQNINESITKEDTKKDIH